MFAARASSVRVALSVAEQHFHDVVEFQSMASDCQHAYFSIRYQMLEPVIRSTIEELMRFLLQIVMLFYVLRKIALKAGHILCLFALREGTDSDHLIIII